MWSCGTSFLNTYTCMRVFKFDQLMYFEYINYCQLIEKTIFVENIKPLAKKINKNLKNNSLLNFQKLRVSQTGFKIKIY